MLAWTKDADGIRANGYLIRLVRPFEWVVTGVSRDEQTAVRRLDEPLATTRTLAEAKREAELLHASERRRDLCRRWLMAMLLACGGAVFSASAAPPWGFIVTFAFVMVAVRSAGLIVGMMLAPFVSQSDDLMYQ